MAGLKVFVSSTTHDLGVYREKVVEVVTKLEQIPISMRDMGASNLSPLQLSLERVRHSDVLVGLLGYRYGEVVPAFNKSITELEYDTANQSNKLVLMYAPDPTHPPTFPSGETIADPRQQAFITRVQRESHTYGAYRDPADLAGIVAADLHRVLTGGSQGIMAYRKGRRELETRNYSSALFDLGWAVHLLPDDGEPPFLLALALLCGRRPKIVALAEIQRVEELLQVAQNLAPRRAVSAFWYALKLDFFVRNGFKQPHLQTAERLARDALSLPRDPVGLDLISWLQPEIAHDYLEPFL